MPFARTDYRYKDTTNIEMDLEELGSMLLLNILLSNITLHIVCIRNATWLGPSHWPLLGIKITYLKHVCVCTLMPYKNTYLKHV